MSDSKGLFGFLSRKSTRVPGSTTETSVAPQVEQGVSTSAPPVPAVTEAAPPKTRPMGKHIASYVVNGKPREAIVEPHMLLVDVIREKLELTGTKRACASGNCGACTVLIDGEPVCSCLTLAVFAEGQEITTVEGLKKPDGTLHPLQSAFIKHCAAQCGFCTSGMLLTASALLAANPRPTRDLVRHGISGNICRCTGYVKIVDAICDAANEMTTANEVQP